MISLVTFDKIYSFDIDSPIKSIPKPKGIDEIKFDMNAEILFNRIVQLAADNSGASDEHRAVNYLSVRYDRIFSLSMEMDERNFSMTSVEVRTSRSSGVRKIVDVIFIFRERTKGMEEQYFVRVDVTEGFPFLHSDLMHYFPR